MYIKEEGRSLSAKTKADHYQPSMALTKPQYSILNMWIILQILFFLLVAPFTDAVTPCHICGDRGNEAMKFPNVILDGVGKTCVEITMDVALKVPINSGQCQQEQNKWGGTCCSGKRPNGSDSPQGLPPQIIPDVRYVGPHPVCNVCRDGDYPSDPSMVMNFLYIGVASCAQYYKYGREGRIAPYMCQPVQFFSYEPCGCGEFSPYFNNNHGQATPQLAPETSPTSAPIALPSARPSASTSEVYIPQSLVEFGQQLTEEDVAAMKKRQTPSNNGKDHVQAANGRGGYGGKNQGGGAIRRLLKGSDK